MAAEHPDRPDHPDFWLLSQILIDTDAQVDNATGQFDEILGRIIPHEVLLYAAQQRALRLSMAGAIPKAMEPSAAAAWLDGFLAGAQFKAAKDRQTGK